MGEDPSSNRTGTWFVVGQFVLLAAVGLAGPLGRGVASPIPLRGVALGLGVAAAWFGLAGVWDLGKHLTPMPLPKADSELVTQGIYARVRHPLYASMMALSVGWSLWWSSLASIGASIVLIGLLHAKARFEEGWLLRRFPGYGDYMRRVPRYLPWGRS